MHEFSLAHALLRQVDTLSRDQAARRVLAIRVSVGEFAGVEPELFRRAFEMLIDGTPMQEAQLHMDCVPLESRCNNCGRGFAVKRFRFECPDCHSRQVTIVRGQDLMLEDVTIEQSDDASTDQSTT